jgi:hypothetical protein
MAGLDGRDDEIDALLGIEGIDTEKIAAQVAQSKGEPPPVKKDDSGGATPPADTKKPEDKKPDPAKSEEKKDVPSPEAIQAAMLNEMFGEQFKSVEDVKKANIPASLQELETLRQKTKELETQLQVKPKTQFVNEDIAKLNEFIRETGIKDVGIFNRLNVTEVANMSDIDALVFQHIIDNPSLSSKEPQVRRYIETRYNVDSSKVESGDLTQEELDINLIGVATEGAKAKAKLLDLKGKIKMPEPTPDETSGEGKKKWTPQIEADQKASWSVVNTKIGEKFGTLGIPIKGSEKPVINFAVPEETRNRAMRNAVDFMLNNQMEVNEANVKSVAQMAYQDLILSNLDQIVHAVFEHARSMKEEEYLKLYHNPSPKMNTDTAGGGGAEESDEAKLKRAFEAELNR